MNSPSSEVQSGIAIPAEVSLSPGDLRTALRLLVEVRRHAHLTTYWGLRHGVWAELTGTARA